MLEAIRGWFQDWSDACEYANECMPDFSFIDAFHPNKWLQIITVLAFIILAVNEWRIKHAQHERTHNLNKPGHNFTFKTILSG